MDPAAVAAARAKLKAKFAGSTVRARAHGLAAPTTARAHRPVPRRARLPPPFRSPFPQSQPSGKGTQRRNVKAVKKADELDEKKLGAALKKLNVQPIPGVEEVTIFKEDGNLIHFNAPKGASSRLSPPRLPPQPPRAARPRSSASAV